MGVVDDDRVHNMLLWEIWDCPLRDVSRKPRSIRDVEYLTMFMTWSWPVESTYRPVSWNAWKIQLVMSSRMTTAGFKTYHTKKIPRVAFAAQKTNARLLSVHCGETPYPDSGII